jgi:monoamine oxidase
MFQPIGGMDQFPKGFERKLADVITFGAAIASVRQSDRDVKVAYRDTRTGAMAEVTADYCVSCLPLPILATLDTNLSAETMAAVKATNYSPSAKMGLQMKRRFWEEDDRIFGGHLYSNLPVGDFAYPSTGYFGDKGVLLGFYGSGRTAELIDKPVAERIEHVLMHTSTVHPQRRAESESGYWVWWERVPYSQGAFGCATGDRQPVIGRPDNRVYSGCAAVSGNGGWMEGAIGAGWKQVKALHERVMGA